MIKTNYKLITPSTTYPVTITEVKEHLRLDSAAFVDDLTQTNSINPASYTTGTTTGAAVDVSLAGEIVALLNMGEVTAGGTVTAYLAESDDNVTFTSVTGSTFTAVTPANDNATYEKAYTGQKQYIRVVAETCGAAAVFGAVIQEKSPAANEDTWIEEAIFNICQYAQQVQARSYFTQTYEMYLDEFPTESTIEFPILPVTDVTSITYKDSAGTVTTWTTDNYNFDEEMIWLEYNKSFPSFTPYPHKAITITFQAGSTSLDKWKENNRSTKHWILQALSELYDKREKDYTELNTKGLLFHRNWRF